jgi:hypothetical protein
MYMQEADPIEKNIEANVLFISTRMSNFYS